VPLPIQRSPRGLNTLLSLFGGQTPQMLADQVSASLEMLQFYGLTQLQTRSASNAALAQGGTLTITVPDAETWVLFNAAGLIARTATQTALAASVQIGPTGGAVAVARNEATNFGATVLGSWRVPFVAPYPRVLLPGHAVSLALDTLGTDANANVLLSVAVGVLG